MRVVASLAAALLALGLVVAAQSVVASEPSAAPMLRIEAGAHVLPIAFVALDHRHNRAITAGIDKTIRIWQLPELRLVRTLRLPIGAGYEGTPYSASISPDGRRLAVGGNTGWQWNQTASIYIFDVNSGHIVKRIGGFPSLISALTYSDDGRLLLVGLKEKQGLRALDAHTFVEVGRDSEYGNDVVDISSVEAGGWVVAASLDGALRVYDSSLHLVQRQPLGISMRPGYTAELPGQPVFALGFQDLPVVAVFHLPDLKLQFAAKVEGDPDQTSLCCAGWSADGSLMATGTNRRDRALVFRWDRDGKSLGAPLDLGRSRPGGKAILDDGSVLFTTDEPRLTLVAPDGRVLRSLGSPARDLTQVGASLRLSSDGRRVSWATPGQAREAFDVVQQHFFNPDAAPTGQSGDAAPGTAVRLAVRDAPSAPIVTRGLASLIVAARTVAPLDERALLATDWAGPNKEQSGWSFNCANPEHPVLNGQALTLDQQEECRQWAYDSTGSAIVVGTTWSLARYDHVGHAVWHVYVQGNVLSLNVSHDGRYVVAALADGSLRWYSFADGRELLGLFLHSNHVDWVLWRPDGYYASSPAGDQFVGWHVNQGQDTAPLFYRAVQFERIFYRPDLLRAQLDEPAHTTDSGPLVTISELKEIAPPIIEVTEGTTHSDGQAQLQVSVDGQGKPIDQYIVYQNDIPILRPGQRALQGADRSRFTREVRFTPSVDGDEIRVEAFNGRSMGLAEYYLRIPGARPRPAVPGDLYLLAVGVNHFARMAAGANALLPDLSFAAQDAQAIAHDFAAAQGHPYAHVHVMDLSDGNAPPTRDAVVNALSFLNQAGAGDTAILFLASHGFSDEAGNYFFVPRDATEDDLRAAVGNHFIDSEPATLISWRVFFDAMREVAGRRLLIVDTCNSQAISGSFDDHSLKKRSSASLFAIMTATEAGEASQEYAPGKHGLFTYSLIDGLQTRAGGSRVVSIVGAYQHARELVGQLHDPSDPQTPQLLAPPALEDTPLIVR